ncbi:MAG: transporter substrate-binding domain-containing protein [Clostridia bacterium]|nr:transporter substrate-binding domain-containing protein [Clostridia bacterium]
MKKFIGFMLCAMMILTAAFAMADVATLSSVKDKGELVIASSPDFPPFESLQGDGSVTGIEIDIMETVAEKLGVKLTIEQVNFDSILLGVMNGSYDMGVSGFSVTEERKKNVLFTDPYCLAAQAIVVVEGSNIASKADLDGKMISVQSGTTAELFCLQNGYTIDTYTANVDAELAVLNGTVDAWVIDDLTAAEMVASNNAGNGKKLVILSEAMTTEPYAFAFAKGSDDLVGAINYIVNEMVTDGTIAALFEKYNAPYTSPAAAN